MTTPTRSRRAALRELLSGGRASTQTALCSLLAAQGHAVTQSTVSRDLKRLGAQRAVGDDGVPTYRLASAPRTGLAPGMVVDVEHNEAMIVMRTQIGRAQAVGFDLDALELPLVLGTLAGDDTVLVVPRSVTQTEELAGALRQLAGL
ncbi:MAG: hypothetical protein K0V04_05485 [Deltaproteobacteria bacterium]|nr:hypothetical protein [Deltaproteobacteria bacterium]